jgi:hypothetical protein
LQQIENCLDIGARKKYIHDLEWRLVCSGSRLRTCQSALFGSHRVLNIKNVEKLTSRDVMALDDIFQVRREVSMTKIEIEEASVVSDTTAEKVDRAYERLGYTFDEATQT